MLCKTRLFQRHQFIRYTVLLSTATRPVCLFVSSTEDYYLHVQYFYTNSLPANPTNNLFELFDGKIKVAGTLSIITEMRSIFGRNLLLKIQCYVESL